MSLRSTLFGAAAALALGEAVQAQDATAMATFLDGQGVEIGTASLIATESGVEITGELIGIPAGEHGFHVHETGNCDPTTGFESASGHFEPGTKEHGLENPAGPHAGDIPNQTPGEDGVVRLAVTTQTISLSEGEANVFDDDGSALVLHANPDDNVSQPSGNSGDRIACAVIEAAPAQ